MSQPDSRHNSPDISTQIAALRLEKYERMEIAALEERVAEMEERRDAM